MRRRERIDHFRAFLSTLHDQREGKYELVEFAGSPMPLFQLLEVVHLYEEINRLRKDRGLDEVLFSQVVRQERQAQGLSDYAKTLAIFAADMCI
jgi:hypothetical protein